MLRYQAALASATAIGPAVAGKSLLVKSFVASSAYAAAYEAGGLPTGDVSGERYAQTVAIGTASGVVIGGATRAVGSFVSEVKRMPLQATLRDYRVPQWHTLRLSLAAPNRALRLPATDTTIAGTTTLGYTTPNGQVFLQPGLSRLQQAATLRHEGVHAFLSAKGSGPIAEFRQTLGVGAYRHSQLLRYTEEAIAETVGSGSLRQGLLHPLVNDYGITPGGLLFEGSILGGGLFGAGYLGYQLGGGE